MDLRTVNSSNLSRVGHDANENILIVEFKNGIMYQYNGVTEDVYSNLMNAPSVGKFFNMHIKNRYTYNKIKIEE